MAKELFISEKTCFKVWRKVEHPTRYPYLSRESMRSMRTKGCEILIAVILLAGTGKAQSKEEWNELLKKIDSSLSEISSLHYTCKAKNKGKPPKVYERTCNAYIRRNDENKFNIDYFANFISNSNKQIYTGENIFHIDSKDSTVTETNTSLHGYGDIEGNYINNYIRLSFFQKDHYFKRYRASKIKEIKDIKDTTINEAEAKLLRFSETGNDFLKNIHTSLAVRKSDHLPTY